MPGPSYPFRLYMHARTSDTSRTRFHTSITGIRLRPSSTIHVTHRWWHWIMPVLCDGRLCGSSSLSYSSLRLNCDDYTVLTQPARTQKPHPSCIPYLPKSSCYARCQPSPHFCTRGFVRDVPLEDVTMLAVRGVPAIADLSWAPQASRIWSWSFVASATMSVGQQAN